ncbi:MAG TPA: class I SAM-dependent methyltransferase [Rubricoccaceae bacterium]|nr:class I SAM-dependent methyltransferase [Rubricoccaceae bacterium]
MPLPPRLLAAALVPLARAQRGRLGAFAGPVERAARLRLSPAEAAAEAAVDRLRATLAASKETLHVEDYGAGTRGLLAGETKPAERRVADVYRRAAAPPGWGRFLFQLVRALRPRRVLELGTSLGVSAAHLAAALALNEAEGGPAGRLVTLEGDPGLAARAADALAGLGHAGRTTVVVGRFAETLPDVLGAHGPFDLVFLDGHHEEAATLRYFETIRPHLAPGACVAFDDVEPGRPVRRAWRRVLRDARPAGAVDLLGLGLLFLPDAPPAAPPVRVGRERVALAQ